LSCEKEKLCYILSPPNEARPGSKGEWREKELAKIFHARGQHNRLKRLNSKKQIQEIQAFFLEKFGRSLNWLCPALMDFAPAWRA
jgi:hypothetical protein